MLFLTETSVAPTALMFLILGRLALTPPNFQDQGFAMCLVQEQFDGALEANHVGVVLSGDLEEP